MPIYEFKCTKCEEFFEILMMSGDDEIKCPKCGSQSFERVMSSTNYSMGGSASGGGSSAGVTKQDRTCSSGSCSTYTIPGSA